MAQRILILSPLHNLGTTAISVLLGHYIALNGRTVTMSFTDSEPYIAQYTSIHDLDDPMRSVTQVVKLIDTNAIENQDILRYSHTIVKNLYFMNTSTEALSEAIKLRTVTSIFERVQSDVVICDCSEDIDSPITLQLLKKADMVFVVTNVSPKVFIHTKQWLEYSPLKDKAETYYVINQYNETAGALRDMAKMLNRMASRVCKVHYNPWISKCCLNGKLHTIMPLVQQKDYRVANLYGDFQEIGQAVNSNLVYMQTTQVEEDY